MSNEEQLITYNVQLAHFKSNQVEERGEVTEEQAVETLSGFPFEAELVRLVNFNEGCVPTITFHDSRDDSSLAIWLDDSRLYTIEGQIGKRSFGHEKCTESKEKVIQVLIFFLQKNLDGINQLIGRQRSLSQVPLKLFVSLILEVPVLILTTVSFRSRLSVGDFILRNPTSTQRFFIQLVFLNCVAIVLLWAVTRHKK